jgi:hypothetical protein
MRIFKECYGTLRLPAQGSKIEEYLAALDDAVDRQPKFLPWTFGDFWSFKDSSARFDAGTAPRAYANFSRRTESYGDYLERHKVALDRLASLEWTPIEEVFRRFGFEANAEALRSQRIEQVGLTRELADTRGQMKSAIGPEWQPPLRGLALAGDARGYFPDGMMGKRLRFTLTARAAISTLRVEGFCPPLHDGYLQLTCTVGGSEQVTVDVQPGSMFVFDCPARLVADQHALVELRSSAILNMLELGEGEDARDISVVIVSIEALP